MPTFTRPAAAALAVLVVGCSGPQVRLEAVAEPSAPLGDTKLGGIKLGGIKLGGIKKVVLVPLLNRSADAGAAPAMYAALARALVAGAGVEVAEVPQGVPVDADRLSREDASELARMAAADGVLTGIIFAYGYVTEAGARRRHMVTVDIRLFSGGKPDLLWVARASGLGGSGIGNAGATLTTVADAVAQEVAADLRARR